MSVCELGPSMGCGDGHSGGSAGFDLLGLDWIPFFVFFFLEGHDFSTDI